MTKSKKITAAILAAMILASAILLPKLFTEKSDDFTVGVGELGENYVSPLASTAVERYISSQLFSSLKCKNEDTTMTASDDVPSVASSWSVFYTDANRRVTESFEDGGFTAASYVLKDGAKFSNGDDITTEDVLFSLYVALDPLSEGYNEAFSSLCGYRDYVYGIDGFSALVDTAKRIISNDDASSVAPGDGYTISDAVEVRGYLSSTGAEFANRIKNYVLSNYSEDGMLSCYIIDGITSGDLEGDPALAAAYAVRMWNYGTFIYEYEEDAHGDYVGTYDADSRPSVKTTYVEAMDSDSLTKYVPDDNGEYTFDAESGEYVKDGEGERFSKALADGYTRFRRSRLAGFRDIDGNAYTLDGDSYPTDEIFFDLMKNTYTSDGVFDYEEMERTESVDSYSFSEAAAVMYASSHTDGTATDRVSGIVTDESEVDGKTVTTLTLYFEGNNYETAYNADFFILSRRACLDGTGISSDGAFPKASEELFDNIKKSGAAVTSGAYTIDSAEDGRLTLSANGYFSTLTGGAIGAVSENVTFLKVPSPYDAVVSKDVTMALTSGDVAAHDGIEIYHRSGNSYKYLLINPAYYKNADVRRAIASTVNTAALAPLADSSIGVLPAYYDCFASSSPVSYDKDGDYAAEHFISAGYYYDGDGVLIDRATSSAARFTFTLPEEERGKDIEKVLMGSIEILKKIGADGEIVYSDNLKERVFSGETIPIYVLGWKIDRADSLFDRYSYTSGTNAVRACGLTKLYTAAQIDAMGRITYSGTDGKLTTSNQSDAVETLDKLIREGMSTVQREERNSHYAAAERLIGDLVFEIPLSASDDVVIVSEGATNGNPYYLYKAVNDKK